MNNFFKNCNTARLFILFTTIFIFGLIKVPVSQASAENTITKTDSYVALGDSFSSGFGVEPYDTNNDCKRSVYAYPEIITDELKLSLSFYACSGASTKDFASKQSETQNAQLDYLTNDTKLVTLTIGGNDVGFSSIVAKLIYNLSESGETIKEAEERIKALNGEITIPGIISYNNLFNEIKKKAPSATVIVVGYPHLFSETADCGNTLSQVNKTWINATTDKLNNILKTNAQKNNFMFVQPNFSGHELSSLNNDWISPIFIPNTNTINPSALHPTQAGQKAIAEIVIKTIKTANQDTVSSSKKLRSENEAKTQFNKIYKRKANNNNIYDKNALTIMSNGLNSAKRNFLKELQSIKTFVKTYKQLPYSALDWNIIQAIAYSGAKR